jgi:hypothetical protein
MLLICFDGSEDSRSGIQHAAEILDGQPATVLTVWEPFTEVLTRTSFGVMPVASGLDIAEIDAATRTRAETLAQEGGRVRSRARSHGRSSTKPRLSTRMPS